MTSDILGIIELTSIAAGFRVLDAVIKAAPVRVLRAEALNPGKYIIFLTGALAPVEFAMDAGVEAGDDDIVCHTLLKNLNSQVLPALDADMSDSVYKSFGNNTTADSLGIIETYTLASAVRAADLAAKAAEIRVCSIVSGNETGGRGITTIIGEIGDVEFATASIVDGLKDGSKLYRKVIIPGPPVEMKGFLCGNK